MTGIVSCDLLLIGKYSVSVFAEFAVIDDRKRGLSEIFSMYWHSLAPCKAVTILTLVSS